MNYSQSLQYLDSFLNLEKIDWQQNDFKWNQDRMRTLLRLFDLPQENYFSVIIAGTKGKGSTGFFLETLLEGSKKKTGFYSSPHLVSPRERIRIAGKKISRKLWADGLTEIRAKLAKTRSEIKGEFTYFEISTLLAALLFKKKHVQIGVFEVGLGGRLDATRAIEAELAILTPIDKDHEAILGNTIAKIAGEKAAVIEPSGWVVASPQKKEAMRVIKKNVRERNARFSEASPLQSSRLILEGDYQKINAGAAYQAAEIIGGLFGFIPNAKHLEKSAVKRSWPGRLETVARNPDVILDGAHNPVSVQALAGYWKKNQKKGCGSKVLVFGSQQDKDYRTMLKCFSQVFDVVVLTESENVKAVAVSELLEAARRHFKRVIPTGKNTHTALKWAREIVGKKGKVLVAGSFYLIGRVKEEVNNGKN